MTLPRPEQLRAYCAFLDSVEAAIAARQANENAWRTYAIANVRAEEKQLAWQAYENEIRLKFIKEKKGEIENGTFFRPPLLEGIRECTK